MFDGQRLADWRNDKGWSQTELAKRLGVTQKTVSKYETGILTPNKKVLLKIAKLFDKSLDYLFCLINDEVPYSRDKYIILPDNYTKEMKADIVKYIDFLNSKQK